MTIQQAFQLFITFLFVVAMIELVVALTLFHIRMWREEQAKKRAQQAEKKRQSR